METATPPATVPVLTNATADVTSNLGDSVRQKPLNWMLRLIEKKNIKDSVRIIGAAVELNSLVSMTFCEPPSDKSNILFCCIDFRITRTHKEEGGRIASGGTGWKKAPDVRCQHKRAECIYSALLQSNA